MSRDIGPPEVKVGIRVELVVYSTLRTVWDVPRLVFLLEYLLVPFVGTLLLWSFVIKVWREGRTIITRKKVWKVLTLRKVHYNHSSLFIIPNLVRKINGCTWRTTVNDGNLSFLSYYTKFCGNVDHLLNWVWPKTSFSPLDNWVWRLRSLIRPG